MKKRLMSLALVLSMVISMVPAVFAAENEPAETETLKYVSLGDSMTNGYGLADYEIVSEEDFVNGYGEKARISLLVKSRTGSALCVTMSRVPTLGRLPITTVGNCLRSQLPACVLTMCTTC